MVGPARCMLSSIAWLPPPVQLRICRDGTHQGLKRLKSICVSRWRNCQNIVCYKKQAQHDDMDEHSCRCPSLLNRCHRKTTSKLQRLIRGFRHGSRPQKSESHLQWAVGSKLGPKKTSSRLEWSGPTFWCTFHCHIDYHVG